MFRMEMGWLGVRRDNCPLLLELFTQALQVFGIDFQNRHDLFIAEMEQLQLFKNLELIQFFSFLSQKFRIVAYVFGLPCLA